VQGHTRDLRQQAEQPQSLIEHWEA